MSHLAIRPRAGRLVTAAGAVVATCALSLAACAAATTTTASAAPTAPSISTCTGATDLHLRIPNTKGSKRAGITYYTLDFTNTSGSVCSLSGYPYVSMISRAGRPARQPGGPRPDDGSTAGQVLAPGATAHTTLAYHGGKVSGTRRLRAGGDGLRAAGLTWRARSVPCTRRWACIPARAPGGSTC